MQDARIDTAQAAPAATSRRGLVLGLMLLAYTFNFIDRTIIGTVGEAVKIDLGLTDTQLGLLGGLSFAILYTLLGIPIARLAERWNRVSIISIALVVWSGFTAACGAAQNFVQLLLMRIGVGVGEAGCSPPAHSLLSDYFEPNRRATALAIYSFGIPLGTMIGAAAGGWLTEAMSWRMAFVIVGLPGIVVAVLIKWLVAEPPRTGSGVLPPLSLRNELRELGQVARRLFLYWPVAHMVFGITIASFATYGVSQFTAPYFIRAFGLNYTEVGLVTGLVYGVSAGIGTLLGGFATDRFAARGGARWYALTPGIGLLLSAPIYMWAYVQPSWEAAAATLLIPGIFSYTCLGPTYGMVQNVVQPRQRATATALLLFFLNFIALGFGPPVTGWIIDQFAQIQFATGEPRGVLELLRELFAPLSAQAGFHMQCPGGMAPAGATLELEQRCRGALVLATRSGILVVLAAYAWAGLHYVVASFGLRDSAFRS